MDHFVAFIEPGMFKVSATVLDLTRGFLFLSPDKIIITPAVSVSSEWVSEVLESINNFEGDEYGGIHAVFGSLVKYINWFKTVVGLTFVRDLIRIYTGQKRAVPPEIVKVIRSYASAHHSWGSFEMVETSDRDSFEQRINGASVGHNRNDEEEWRAAVESMYGRPPPTKRRVSSLPQRETQKPIRNRKLKRKYQDSEDESETNMDVDATTPVFVVENWLQCDECTKWRLVSEAQQQSFQDRFFQCSDVGKDCVNDPSDDLVNRI